ncbi:MAG: hypothetical protein J6A10_08970 [Peptococcaceae bacterium]|nr:hypothetical protein [Peptococcaceae bacterium]
MVGLSIFYLIVFAVIIAIAYFVAKEFYYVAEQKGYTERKYFWYAFLLNWIGYLLIIALPDRGGNNKSGNIDIDQLPTL